MPNERRFSRLTAPRAAAVVLSLAVPAFAQPDPSGIDFVIIGAPGNPAYNGPDPTGRGSVGYEFKLSRSEVTTAQWLEFFNTFKARPDAVPDHIMPIPFTWGAEVDPTYTGPGWRFRLRAEADAGIRPVYGIDWRTSARFSNWLLNNKGVALSTIANGAYDASTYGISSPGQFTDQITRHPVASARTSVSSPTSTRTAGLTTSMSRPSTKTGRTAFPAPISI
ncbi:MAG: hypothetical protein JNK25_03110 [Phycisphaerae bacterium]|nr:hypothetical protein [Phycisphaerae bacterium]